MSYLRLGKQVCQKINQILPHVSTTKMNRLVDHLSAKNPSLLNDYYQISSSEFMDGLRSLQAKSSPKDSKILSIFSWFNRKAIPEMNSAREAYNIPGATICEKMQFNIKQLLNRRLGNCQENAIAATAALKMNGIKNSCIATLKHNETNIDHVVSVFNKDGSMFTGEIINNKTIIVDPWLGVVDYANNYFAKNRDLLKQFMYIPEDGKLGLHRVNQFNIDENEILSIKKMFPELSFNLIKE